MQHIEELVTSLVESQKKMQEQLETINRRLCSIEESTRLNTNAATQTLTYTKRLQPYIEKAMRALHHAFQMVANGILNLREETSEFAGSFVDTEYDTDYIKRV